VDTKQAPETTPTTRRRRRLDPALKRSVPLTVMVDAALADQAWTAAEQHPGGMSGLLRDALTARLAVIPSGANR